VSRAARGARPTLVGMTRTSTTLVLCLLLAPSVGAAQAPDPATEALAGARAALDEGSAGRAFELARLARWFDPSRSLQAYEMMGRAAFELGRHDAAHRFFRRALVFAEGRDRARLLARLRLARDELGLVRVDLQPGGAELPVDGAPAEFEAGERTLLLRPGAHELVARLEGHDAVQAIVHVVAGGAHTVHLVLREGSEQRTRAAPRPRDVPEGRRWLAGNAMLIGVGTLGLAASGGVSSALHPSLSELNNLQVGVSVGLVTGAVLNMMAQAAFDPRGRGDLMFYRFLAVPVLAVGAVTIAAAAWGPARSCADDGDPCQTDIAAANTAAGAVGLLGGMMVSTAANAVFGGRETPVGIGLGIASAWIGVLEGLLALVSMSTANELRDAAEEQLGAARADRLEAAAAHDAYAQVAGGVSLGFVALAAASFAVGIAGDRDDLDLTVSAGPGTLSVAGTF